MAADTALAHQQNPDAEPAPDAPKAYPLKPINWKDDLTVHVEGNAIHIGISDPDHAIALKFDQSPGKDHPAIAAMHKLIDDLTAERANGHKAGWYGTSKANGNERTWLIKWKMNEGEKFSTFDSALYRRIKEFAKGELADTFGGAISQGVSR